MQWKILSSDIFRLSGNRIFYIKHDFHFKNLDSSGKLLPASVYCFCPSLKHKKLFENISTENHVVFIILDLRSHFFINNQQDFSIKVLIDIVELVKCFSIMTSWIAFHEFEYLLTESVKKCKQFLYFNLYQLFTYQIFHFGPHN